ncbi:hypothetical protein GGF46_004933 [Coemansia sp. RSA 552]|nr:hypothetical protein GGF46_004933 [Coemansia sp. RSA 552]
MPIPPVADSADEAVARRVAQGARDARDRTDHVASSYIPAYIAEYLDDLAGVLRRLRAWQGDSDAAMRSLERTLEWREEGKVYPARKAVDTQGMRVDAQGMVLVRGRRASLLPPRRVVQQTAGGRVVHGGRYYGRSVEALEDARVALKAVYGRFRISAQAALVVPVESLSLADVGFEDVVGMVDVAREHYPETVGVVYVTASSSVLLEHARQALQPVLGRLQAHYRTYNPVIFCLDHVLAASTIGVEELAAKAQHRQNGVQEGSSPATLGTRLLLARIGRGASACSDTEVDDFHSACSGGLRTQAGSMKHPALSLPSCCSFQEVGYQLQPLSPSDTLAPDLAAPEQAKPTMTLVQLASLQRAVQSVQSMLGSINDSIASANSRTALAATKSRLVQQADVLRSTVAALSFGVSMMEGRSAAHSGAGEPAKPRRAFYVTAGRPSEAPKPATLLRHLALQLLALPMGLLVGRPRDSIRVLRALAGRLVRVVVSRIRHFPKLQSLVLLAYLWAGGLLAWQANTAMIWSNLTTQWRRGISL